MTYFDGLNDLEFENVAVLANPNFYSLFCVHAKQPPQGVTVRTAASGQMLMYQITPFLWNTIKHNKWKDVGGNICLKILIK